MCDSVKLDNIFGFKSGKPYKPWSMQWLDIEMSIFLSHFMRCFHAECCGPYYITYSVMCSILETKIKSNV